MVPAFTDFKLHDITGGPGDPNIEPLDMNQPAGSPAFFAGNPKFLTRKLWDCGKKPNSFHHGKFTTLRQAVEAHAGEAGAAAGSRIRPERSTSKSGPMSAEKGSTRYRFRGELPIYPRCNRFQAGASIGHHHSPMIQSKIRLAFSLLTVLIPLVSGPAARVEAGPVKVFILAGQSNMEGKGSVETGYGNLAGAIGSLRYMVNNDPARYGHLASGRRSWVSRDDVWIWSTTDNGEKGNLTVGFGSGDAIGPELGFGNVIGDLYEDQVLLIKTAWGGKSLAVDFRPPRAGAPGVGFYYNEMRNKVRFVLDNLATEFPDYAGQGYEMIGFGWHQGWNDRVNQAYTDEYEANLATFIWDIRNSRYGFGVPDLPFVVAETGMTGYSETNPGALRLMAAQAAVADPAKYPKFEGNVAFVGTRGFWRDASQSPLDQGYHWNQNGETYYLIGEAMGQAMASLVQPPMTNIELSVTLQDEALSCRLTGLPAGSGDQWVLQSSADLKSWEDLVFFGKEAEAVSAVPPEGQERHFLRARHIEADDPVLRGFLTARNTWRSAGIGSYTMEVRWQSSWFFWHGTVTVRNNEVISAVPIDTNFFEPPEQRTIDGWFAHLKSLIDQEAEQIDVTFDPVLGYTKSAFVDISLMIADEEQSWSILDFQPQP